MNGGDILSTKVNWEGYVDVEKTDSIRFFVDAQGAYRLWIDGTLALDASQSQSFDVRNTAISAKKGDAKHIRLEFCNQRSTPAEIRMGYAYQSDIDFSEAKRLLPKPIWWFSVPDWMAVSNWKGATVLSTCLTDKIC